MAPKPPSPPPLPPVSAEFRNVVHLADPKAAAQESTSRLFRAADGRTRLDAGQSSVITLPAQKQSIALDHAKKEARIIPMPANPLAPPPPPASPGMPTPPKPPPPPTVHVQDLGKKMMDGHEVLGKNYTVHPPHVQMPHFPMPPLPEAALPKPPAAPHAPQPPHAPQAAQLEAAIPGAPKLAAPKLDLPKVPGVAAHAPQAPKPPAVPAMLPPPPPLPPPSPVVTEVWTSTKHAIPMLTTTTGSFGKQMAQCRKLVPGEPPPSVFQIPHGYKIV